MQMSLAVSLGDVLQIASTIIVIVAAYFRLRERLAVIETKLTVLWERRRAGER